MKIQLKRKSELKEILKNIQINDLKTCIKCQSNAREVTIKGKRMLQCCWRPCRYRSMIKTGLKDTLTTPKKGLANFFFFYPPFFILKNLRDEKLNII